MLSPAVVFAHSKASVPRFITPPAEDKTFYGKIEGVNDLATFEAATVEGLERAFHEAVEDYVMLCKEAKKEPLKSCKGSFNVRVSPEVHRKALEKATLLGISLNQLVQDAIEHEVRATRVQPGKKENFRKVARHRGSSKRMSQVS
jgi:predicted HicB family RNase H-like nuclease